VAASDELAFLKIRFKKPDAGTSELLSLPVTDALKREFAAAPDDVRFSVAVAAFGQKLRDADALANFGFEQIGEIANAAKGKDEFGYRGEFVGLVRLAGAMAGR
jgi:Ca-activated chloride channel family protein